MKALSKRSGPFENEQNNCESPEVDRRKDK